MKQFVIEAKDLSIRFGPRTALDSLSFAVPKGTSTALVGPNGCGKTTLLNVISGLLSPSSGTIVVDTDSIGFVLQHSSGRNWLPLTCLEVVRMGRYQQRGFLKRFSKDDHQIVAESAERAEVTELLGEQFGELSGGERQRVLIAQVLAQKAELLLLDEPITGLDLVSQDQILAILAAETQAGRTVLLTTHHLEEARKCDAVYLLANKLVATGSPEEVLVPDVLEKAYGSRLLRLNGEATLLDEHGHA